MKTSTLIAERINRLTSDEDLRQELWVYYLEGNSPDTFVQHLEYLKSKASQQEQVDRFANDLIQQPFSRRLSDILTHFTQVERSVIFMLLLGYNAEDMSNVNSMSKARTRQMIQNIKSNTHWNEVREHGTETRF